MLKHGSIRPKVNTSIEQLLQVYVYANADADVLQNDAYSLFWLVALKRLNAYKSVEDIMLVLPHLPHVMPRS